MKGAYGVGAGLALEELGFNEAFSSIVGVSSGAPSAAYFVAHETDLGAGLIWDECCSREFINVWRFWNQVNTNYFMNTVRGGTGRGLNAETALASPVDLYIAVSNFTTGEPELLKPETPEELFQAIQASILMPNVSRDLVKIKDIRYADGGFTRPHSLRLAVDSIPATHVLIIANQNKILPNVPKLERFLNHTVYRHRMPAPLRFAAHERKRERMKALEYMEAEYHTPYALVWGDHSILSMERDPKKVRSVVERSRRWWLELLAR
jgi:predicted patatin/cPLA2 family phospholipase